MDPLLTKEKIKKIILEAISEEKPENTIALIQVMLQQHSINEETTTEILIELEKEGKIHLEKPETRKLTSTREYIFSQKALWYWVSVSLSIAASLSVFTIPETTYPAAYLRNVLGLIFVLFLPGYVFIKVLFPTKVSIKTTSENLNNIERIALSIGTSLALVPIIGLVHYYTPWGVQLIPIYLSLLALIVICATAAVLREHQTYQ